VLAADAAYVRLDRLPAFGSAARDRFWRLAPDLVAEVASPGQSRDHLEAKAQVWLGAGVRLVWNVWPKRQQVDVWRSDTAGAAHLVATLKASAGDLLDGLDVLPGFTCPLTALFSGD
jgi:Uma2 family endonuclease